LLVCVYLYVHVCVYACVRVVKGEYVQLFRLVGSLKTWVSNSKEPCKRDNILQKRPILVCVCGRGRVCTAVERLLWTPQILEAGRDNLNQFD